MTSPWKLRSVVVRRKRSGRNAVAALWQPVVGRQLNGGSLPVQLSRWQNAAGPMGAFGPRRGGRSRAERSQVLGRRGRLAIVAHQRVQDNQ